MNGSGAWVMLGKTVPAILNSRLARVKYWLLTFFEAPAILVAPLCFPADVREA